MAAQASPPGVAASASPRTTSRSRTQRTARPPSRAKRSPREPCARNEEQEEEEDAGESQGGRVVRRRRGECRARTARRGRQLTESQGVACEMFFDPGPAFNPMLSGMHNAYGAGF